MKEEKKIPVIHRNTIIVGSGAAGFAAAERLFEYGQRDIGIVTEGISVGTSRNAGSDKQTYYKLTLSGAESDSVREMAQNLFSGQCVDGDTALCEAALSVQCFLHLAELGVPFPQNGYGEYVGYKTDHDPHKRATSAGPYTSKLMTEALEQSVKEKGIAVYDRLQVIRILSDGERTAGLLCLNLDADENEDMRFAAFCCKNIIWATGGPAGIYRDSVYPEGQYGASGLAFLAGAKGRNLTEWQYGLASLKPRWNVSGSYMQVLPRFVSTLEDGSDEREFLYEHFQEEGELLTRVFLKGYQWPFDVRKVREGSSMIDLLVYLERKKGRRIFLDYRSNPGKKEIDYSILSQEAREYLAHAGACFGTPFDRLLHMNEPAVEFYREHGVDVSKEMLEISLCAQHNNGGLAVDRWWRTNLEGLFAVGEAAGTHGVYRPGGSALNAGQTGSLRAAQYIALEREGQGSFDLFKPLLEESLSEIEAVCKNVMQGTEDTLEPAWNLARERMSRAGAAIRDKENIERALCMIRQEQRDFLLSIRVNCPRELSRVFRLQDILICQQMVLSAMLDYINKGGGSRGSALYIQDHRADHRSMKEFENVSVQSQSADNTFGSRIQEVLYRNGNITVSWRQVHPLPDTEDFFENVWREYRERSLIKTWKMGRD